MNKEEILALTNKPFNNWAFTPNVIDAIMSVKLGGDTTWLSAQFEIAKAQELLNLYKTAFGLKDNLAVYQRIKHALPQDTNIDYHLLQQYLVDTAEIIKGNLELWHKQYRRQYIRDRIHFIVRVAITNILIKKYVPETDARDLVGFGAILTKQQAIKSAVGQNNNKGRRESILAAIKQPGFFDGCPNLHAKLLRIIKESKKHKTTNGLVVPITEKTARRYLKLTENSEE